MSIDASKDVTVWQEILAQSPIAGPALLPTGKVTVAVVFASWCASCRDTIGVIHNLAQTPDPRWEGNIQILGMNAYEEFQGRSNSKNLASYVREKPHLTVIKTNPSLFAKLGSPPKVPSVYVFRKDGSLSAMFLRTRRPPPSRAELQQAIVAADSL